MTLAVLSCGDLLRNPQESSSGSSLDREDVNHKRLWGHGRSDGPSLPNPQEAYRQRAEECRRLAEKATDPDEQTRWLVLAQEWLRLAQYAALLRADKGNEPE
jgi:hypothetical protein